MIHCLRLVFLLFVSLSFICWENLLAQDQDDDTLKIETFVVSVPVTARDEKNYLVTDLKPEHFSLYEDEQEIPITYFGLDKTPVDVLLLLDTSRSVKEELPALEEAATDFVKHLNVNDRVSIWSFSDSAEQSLGWTAATESQKISTALHSLAASGNTAIYDSVYTTSASFISEINTSTNISRPRRVNKIETSSSLDFDVLPNRRCIIILTDGDDTNSRKFNIDQAVKESLRAEVSVYVISRSKVESVPFEQILNSSKSLTSDRTSAQAQLNRLKASNKAMIKLAERTGGHALFPTRDAELFSTYAEIASELHQRYSIGYTPTSEFHDKKFHTLRIECNRRDIQLWAREGYFAK